MKLMQPDRLKRARLARGLSRSELHRASGISARQIQRIEDADGAIRCRPTTVKGLAQALGLDVPVLTGEAPMPDGLEGGRPSTRIRPERLRRLRERRGWTLKRLGLESGMSPAQIRRVEKGDVGEGRGYTLERLSKALRVEREVLTGDAPLGEAMLPQEAKVQLGARVSAEVRLAFDLVSRRYGAGVRDLIQLAPLLFVLVAEGSLAARAERLECARTRRKELWRLSDEPMLYFAKYLRDVDAGIEAEERSIASRDVLGRSIWESDEGNGRFHEDDLTVTPFEDHLRSMARRFDPDDVRVDPWPEGMTDLWGVSSYRVCGSLLEELYGASDEEPRTFSLARVALQCGAARLSDIPDQLMAPGATSARVEWLEGRLKERLDGEQPEMFEKLAEMRDLGDALDHAQHLRDQAEAAWYEARQAEEDDDEDQ